MIGAGTFEHPDLLGPILGGPSWLAHRVIKKAADGVPLSDVERPVFAQLAGGRAPPTQFCREVVIIAGRRSGKTSLLAGLAFDAACEDYAAYLAPGEQAHIAVIACDKRQAGVAFGRIEGAFRTAQVAPRILRETAEEIELDNGVVIEIHTASFRATRGRTYALVLFDEAAFFRDEDSANPAKELRRAIKPGLSTIPTSRMVIASSPWSRSGLVPELHAAHFARDSDVLVVKADTRTMNPQFDQRIIDEAMAEDPLAARTEYGGEFRSDIAQYLDDELLDAALVPNRRELPRISVLPEGAPPVYFAFCDPSGGRHDAMTLAIAHAVGNKVVLDALRFVDPPFDPATVVAQFAETLTSYGLSGCMGDSYAAEWVTGAFAAVDVSYQPSERDRSALCIEALPLFTNRRVELLDHPRLVSELRGLERRPRPSGRDSVTHGPGGRDDVANCVIGALWRASRGAVFAAQKIFVVPTLLGQQSSDGAALLPPPEGPPGIPLRSDPWIRDVSAFNEARGHGGLQRGPLLGLGALDLSPWDL